VSSVAVRLRGLGRGLGHRRGDEYVLCPEDGTWFRPMYTDGMCPLCGQPIAEEGRGLPLLMRLDGFAMGVGALALASLGMCALVLYAYFTG
jgi:hypothetical protein